MKLGLKKQKWKNKKNYDPNKKKQKRKIKKLRIKKILKTINYCNSLQFRIQI